MTGSVVLITGASRGIGLASAALLAQRGYTVFGTSRTPEQVAVSGFELLKLDVRDQQSADACLQTVLERAGQLDILVNNAGISLGGAVEEATVDDAKALFETNFFGVVRMTNAVLPHMRQRRQGRIINLSSLAGVVGVPYIGQYVASKFALEGYSESLRYELRAFGIHVSLIEPGDIRTDIDNGPPSQRIPDYEGVRDRANAMHKANVENGPPPERVARAVLRAVESRSPSLRYTVTKGHEFGVPWMKRLLPDSLIEWLVRDNYKLDG
jgi:NAD(P)-dependent dehydrogenase (short-subunit alcohol dehydrogenase family)